MAAAAKGLPGMPFKYYANIKDIAEKY